MNINPFNLAAATLLCVIIPTIASAASISGQGTWESTLQGRDLDGDFSNGFEAYYDTVLDITWLANANSGSIMMNWATANTWAANLNPYGSSITGWRLPETGPVNGVSYDYSITYDGSTDRGFSISAPDTVYAGSTGSELAHMFYNTLGNLAYRDSSGNVQADGGLTNTGPFIYLTSLNYWSATEYAPWTIRALYFSFTFGYQDYIDKVVHNHVWVVHDGDVGVALPTSEVPVPAAAWLLGSGLLGLIGLARKRRT